MQMDQRGENKKKAMKYSSITSSSSTKSTTTTMDDRSESCYFPGCRKDTNCNCEICLESISATLDLMPMSIQKSSITKLSASKSFGERTPRTPISFNQSILSTPKSSVYQVSVSPPLKSTAKSIPLEKVEKKKRKTKRSWGGGFGFYIWRFFVGLCLIFAVDSGFSWMVSEVLKPSLSIETVRSIGEQSWVCHDLNERLGFLQKKLGEIGTTGTVLSCSSSDSIWELNQEGLLLNSRCALYKSMAEEVNVWGWPLQTAGLLATGFSSRSLTVLSGRVTEWSDGKMGFSVRNANTSSWLLRRMSASAVQLDPNTWVLEYKQNWILENSRLFSTAFEYLKFRISRVSRELKQQFFLLPDFVQQFSDLTTRDSISHPT